MESISRAIRDHIASAAYYRCEYCQTAQEISGAQMHIEHIIPLAHGGSSDASNLCIMNNPFIVPARRHWVEAGWHPPQAGALA